MSNFFDVNFECWESRVLFDFAGHGPYMCCSTGVTCKRGGSNFFYVVESTNRVAQSIAMGRSMILRYGLILAGF